MRIVDRIRGLRNRPKLVDRVKRRVSIMGLYALAAIALVVAVVTALVNLIF